MTTELLFPNRVVARISFIMESLSKLVILATTSISNPSNKAALAVSSLVSTVASADKGHGNLIQCEHLSVFNNLV
jgi:hypothetical protein